MSLPKDKLDELVKELNNLPENEAEQAVIILQDFIKKKKNPETKQASDFFGFMKNKDFDVDEESKKLRDEWERNIS